MSDENSGGYSTLIVIMRDIGLMSVNCDSGCMIVFIGIIAMILVCVVASISEVDLFL